ncbi:hypothetical protein MMC07_002426 [Pseudocyphellaria aurata]|nr:hypothetical protein [Pseudocyphellaria aurata]
MDENDVLLLEKQFCPPIDTALFFAILSDYDLEDPSSVANLCATLESLRDSVAAEDNTSFDPSGTSGPQDGSSSQDSSQHARSWHGPLLDDTDFSTVSQSLRSPSTDSDVDSEAQRDDDARRVEHDRELEDLSLEDKTKTLIDMFPTMKALDVGYILKKAGNNFSKAVEDLLSYAFLVEEEASSGEPILKKGIDGFAVPSHARGRKTRNERKKESRRTSSTPNPLVNQSANASTALPSRWDRAKNDIEFLTQRTYLSQKSVSSAYHESGASLSLTIATLCGSADSNPYLPMASQCVLQTHASELALEFFSLPLPQIVALIRLTHPSTASAHELARALVSVPAARSSEVIIPHYLPRPRSPTSPQNPLHLSQLPLRPPAAARLTSIRSTAFTQASAAYRKSKSTPLMGGAAAYYSAVARDASASLRQHEEAAAEALVASQSRAGEVDLHGVSVKDGVRIAKDRVERWWGAEGTGEWVRQGKVVGSGLRIVTGVGRHSEGGRGRLGPAVGAMLVKGGWKVEVTEGVVTVVGRARR